VAIQAWTEADGKPFHQRTKDLTTSLKKWVKKKKPLNQQLSEIEHQLSFVQQSPPHIIDHTKEEILIREHNVLYWIYSFASLAICSCIFFKL
jgi:hypothetical protein